MKELKEEAVVVRMDLHASEEFVNKIVDSAKTMMQEFESKHCFLLRESLADQTEISTIKKYFHTTSSRVGIKDKTVIARYSAYPFYKELEEDLKSQGSCLINTSRQYNFIADLGNYTDVLGELTPKTWNHLDQVPDSEFPIIVKGATSGKKFLWNSHMFAKNRAKAIDVMCKLQDDGLVGEQSIYYRKFIPLKTYLIGFHGLPITKEFRVFVYNGKILSKGFYWSNYVEDLPEVPNVDDIPEEFLSKVIDTIGNRAMFYAVDVAETADGGWIVVELNDGQMSGLSENDPEVLYSNLKKGLDEEYNMDEGKPISKERTEPIEKLVIEEDCEPIEDYTKDAFDIDNCCSDKEAKQRMKLAKLMLAEMKRKK